MLLKIYILCKMLTLQKLSFFYEKYQNNIYRYTYILIHSTCIESGNFSNMSFFIFKICLTFKVGCFSIRYLLVLLFQCPVITLMKNLSHSWAIIFWIVKYRFRLLPKIIRRWSGKCTAWFRMYRIRSISCCLYIGTNAQARECSHIPRSPQDPVSLGS